MADVEAGGAAAAASLVLRQANIAAVDRGTGVKTLPFIGSWNCSDNRVTTGMTIFEPGMGIPLHSHNVEETVLLVAGQARVTIGDQSYDIEVGDATWVPAGVPHCFTNRGDGVMQIYWVYGGRTVYRTICATGETVEHLSARDRGVVRIDGQTEL